MFFLNKKRTWLYNHSSGLWEKLSTEYKDCNFLEQIIFSDEYVKLYGTLFICFIYRTATTRFCSHNAHPIRGTLGNLLFWIRTSPLHE